MATFTIGGGNQGNISPFLTGKATPMSLPPGYLSAAQAQAAMMQKAISGVGEDIGKALVARKKAQQEEIFTKAVQENLEEQAAQRGLPGVILDQERRDLSEKEGQWEGIVAGLDKFGIGPGYVPRTTGIPPALAGEFGEFWRLHDDLKQTPAIDPDFQPHEMLMKTPEDQKLYKDVLRYRELGGKLEESGLLEPQATPDQVWQDKVQTNAARLNKYDYPAEWRQVPETPDNPELIADINRRDELGGEIGALMASVAESEKLAEEASAQKLDLGAAIRAGMASGGTLPINQFMQLAQGQQQLAASEQSVAASLAAQKHASELGPLKIREAKGALAEQEQATKDKALERTIYQQLSDSPDPAASPPTGMVPREKKPARYKADLKSGKMVPVEGPMEDLQLRMKETIGPVKGPRWVTESERVIADLAERPGGLPEGIIPKVRQQAKAMYDPSKGLTREITNLRRLAMTETDPARKRRFVRDRALEISQQYGPETIATLNEAVDLIAPPTYGAQTLPGTGMSAITRGGKHIGLVKEPIIANWTYISGDTAEGKKFGIPAGHAQRVVNGAPEGEPVQVDTTERGLLIPGLGDKAMGYDKTQSAGIRDMIADVVGQVEILNENILISEKDRESLSATDRRLAEQNAGILAGKLRLTIIGPGAMSDYERKILEKVVGNPAVIWSFEEAERAAFKNLISKSKSALRQRIEQNVENYVLPDWLKEEAAPGTPGTAAPSRNYQGDPRLGNP